MAKCGENDINKLLWRRLMPHEIKQWNELADNYGDTALLGNGASIAVSKSFLYGSLLESGSFGQVYIGRRSTSI